MNFLTVSRWFVNRYYNTLTELPKRGEFQIPTTTVNAQYLPWSNVIQIPAAELLAPNFDASFPAAINYGLTGFTVGHEMFHAFDDTGESKIDSEFDRLNDPSYLGILFDHRGTLVPDWLFDKESLKIYRAKTRCLVSKYANVCFPEIDSLCINGTATFGENLADTEGVDVRLNSNEACSTDR